MTAAKGSKPTEFDIVIVGAGLAGAALAAGLADLPLRVALVEARPWSTQWPELESSVAGYDPRVSALTESSRQLLEKLDCWEAIASRRVCAYTHMHVWDAEGTGCIDFDAADVPAANLGHIVENRLINTALLEQVESSGRVHCYPGHPVEELRIVNGHPELELESGRVLKARLVVGADGANSRIREWAGFRSREWAYGHSAIACTVRHSQSHQHTAWQSFMSSGPLAFLPLADAESGEQFSSIVWSAVPERADQLMAMDEESFAQELAAAIEHRLGDVEAVGQRFCFPLAQRHAVDYVQNGVVLIGDAAHSIHPLAGQGINLGFQDVTVLLEELASSVERGLSPGDSVQLMRYQRRRKGENLAMMAAMDAFKYLFAADALPLRWLRNTGMKLLNDAAPLKRQIIRRAMGL